MRIAYFDCLSGVSGDMVLGALVDAGLGVDELRSELDKLHLDGFELKASKVMRGSIAATKVDVVVSEKGGHRHLADVLDIIDKSSISEVSKSKAKSVFSRLAGAEAKVHGTTPDKVHFHEVGGIDAIIDIVGAVVGLELMGIDRVYSSVLRLGTGSVMTAHGIIPIPAPGTLALLEGVPVERTSVKSELVTPTGAALISTLSDGFGESPPYRSLSVGYGAGSRDLKEMPNVLRIHVGEPVGGELGDLCTVVETNIDDMSPELYGYVFDRLFDAGAKDVYITPTYMKKERPGVLVSVIAAPELAERIARVLLEETTTIGVRMWGVRRVKLKRRSATVETEFGPVRVKVVDLDGRVRIKPEYDDCLRIAKERGVPILSVYRSVELKGADIGEIGEL